MLFFGHLGITAGVIRAGDLLTQSGGSHGLAANPKVSAAISRWRLGDWLSRARGRLGTIDYRLVLLGSLLPDLIDKPVWFVVTAVTGGTFLSGRDYAHTLLFNLALFSGGLFLARYRKPRLLALSLASLWHLVFDEMWASPVVLLWPLFGPLPREETAGWWSGIIEALLSQPEVYIPEIIGLATILLFVSRLMARKSVLGFLRNGDID